MLKRMGTGNPSNIEAFDTEVCKSCMDHKEVEKHCTHVLGDGSYARVLHNIYQPGWVYRKAVCYKLAAKDEKTYDLFITLDFFHPRTQFITCKELCLLNWETVRSNPSTCVPKMYNIYDLSRAVTDKKHSKVAMTMEKLQDLNSLCKKKKSDGSLQVLPGMCAHANGDKVGYGIEHLKSGFRNAFFHFLLGVGKYALNVGLTHWDTSSSNLAIRVHPNPKRRFVTSCKQRCGKHIRVNTQFYMNNKYDIVMLDFDACAHRAKDGTIYTSKAFGIPEYYLTACSPVGWCRNTLLKLMLSNEHFTTHIFKSRRLLKCILKAIGVFFPEASISIDAALQQMKEDGAITPMCFKKIALALTKISITIFCYDVNHNMSVTEFEKKYVVYKDGPQPPLAYRFWEAVLFKQARCPHTNPIVKFKSSFQPMYEHVFNETKENTHFYSFVINLAKKMHIEYSSHTHFNI